MWKLLIRMTRMENSTKAARKKRNTGIRTCSKRKTMQMRLTWRISTQLIPVNN